MSNLTTWRQCKILQWLGPGRPSLGGNQSGNCKNPTPRFTPLRSARRGPVPAAVVIKLFHSRALAWLRNVTWPMQGAEWPLRCLDDSNISTLISHCTLWLGSTVLSSKNSQGFSNFDWVVRHKLVKNTLHYHQNSKNGDRIEEQISRGPDLMFLCISYYCNDTDLWRRSKWWSYPPHSRKARYSCHVEQVM